MTSASEVKRLLHESLGLPPLPEAKPTVPVEGHICDFPIWSYSRKRATVTALHIDYGDGTFFTLDAPKGMPSPSFPGYLDVILFNGQRDLFEREYVEISVYAILKTLGMDPTDGRNYRSFREDMKRTFHLAIVTDRFRNPKTGEHDRVEYFRVLRRMTLAKSRRETSAFYFDDLFLQSLRSGYLKRLNFDFCLWLDTRNKALSRFLYGHLLKRIGEKAGYTRKLLGFLHDVGLGHIAMLAPKRRTEALKETVFPALDLLVGEVLRQYTVDARGNIFFIPKD